MASIIPIERERRRPSMKTGEGTMIAAGASAQILFFTGVRKERPLPALPAPVSAENEPD